MAEGGKRWQLKQGDAETAFGGELGKAVSAPTYRRQRRLPSFHQRGMFIVRPLAPILGREAR